VRDMLAYFREVRPPQGLALETMLAGLLARVINATRGEGQRPVSLDDVIPWSQINRIHAKGEARELTAEEWQKALRHTYG